jgi:hypothetical protein
VTKGETMTTTPLPSGPVSAGPSKLLIALIAVGGVLLLAVVAIVFLLIGQNSGGSINAGDQTPAPVTSDTATPVAEPTDAPTDDAGAQGDDQQGDGGQPQPDTSLRFTSFTANLQVACDPTGQAEEKAQPQISWSAANATAVYWTPSNRDATADNGYRVGTSGNQNDMSASKGPGERYEFPCNHRQTFDTTITIYGANGQKVSKHVTFTDINWGTGGGDDED